MYKVAFIGAGNISWSLIPSIQKAGCKVIQLISRDEEKLKRFASIYEIEHFSTKIEELTCEADLIFLTVPDQAIKTIVEKLPLRDALFIHTSGSIPIKSLQALGEEIGVFYPMQTFTLQKQVDMREVPIFVEGQSEEIIEKLRQLGTNISNKVIEMNSQDRLRLHLGAVIASNFSNYLYQIINNVLPNQEEIDFSIYEGLIREQLDKALKFGPEHVQTGPAIRGDQITIDKHLQLLEHTPKIRELYLKISQMINGAIRYRP